MNRLACIVVGCLVLLLVSVFLLRCTCLSIRALWRTSEFEQEVQRDRDNAGDEVEAIPFTRGLGTRRAAQGEKAGG
jgi:hypothetical protein